MSDPSMPLTLLAVVAVGGVAGRLARWAADSDFRRRNGRAPGRWPWIEPATVLVLLAVATRFGIGWEAAPYAVIVTALVAVSVADLRSHRIPDRILFPALALSASVMVGAAAVLGEPSRLWWGLGGAALYGGILLAVHLLTPHGMGLGDVKLAILLGAAVGWLRVPAIDTVLLVTWSLLVASALGLAVGLAKQRVVHGRAVRTGAAGGSLRRVRVPFGPALSGATMGVVVLSDRILP